MESGACFDHTGAYRYRLWREWDASRAAVAFVMLNPSTADAGTDDPTIRRCLGFARALGFGRLEVVNLFALRATDPRLLRSHPDPVGPDNDRHIREVAAATAQVVAAWGALGTTRDRAVVIGELLPPSLLTLGLTKCGQPRHPLYTSGTTPFTRLGATNGEGLTRTAASLPCSPAR